MVTQQVKPITQNIHIARDAISSALAENGVGLLTGGGDRHYAFGLAMALVAKGVHVDFVGGDEVDSPELHCTPNLRFLNLRHNGRRDAGLATKVRRTAMYYVRLAAYALTARARVFHILWNNKFEFFDRTLLMLYYKALNRRIVLTAHNVNAGARDGNDTRLNRLTLKAQYRIADHIFVHTERMKEELQEQFGVASTSISVIPYGVNNAAPKTDLTPLEAKQRLGIKEGQRVLLFFGNIAPYKGLQYLVTAYQCLLAKGGDYRLIVAGRAKEGCEIYAARIRDMLSSTAEARRTILRIELIPDSDVELYFKAADVSVLPYTHIFQSGVLFLGYSFGLPVIATDVGSMRGDIVEGKTGFICKPGDPIDLLMNIEKYFESELYKFSNARREAIQEFANDKHSWGIVGELTRSVYSRLLH